MDHEHRMAAAARSDHELAARIIRTIKQVEDDYYMASGPFSERLMQEAVLAVGKAVQEPWQVVPADLTVQIVCPEWKMSKGVATGDAWLEIVEVGADDEREFSWISAAVGAGPTRMGLELVFRRGLQDFAQTAIRDDKLVAALWKLGMAREEQDAHLYFPIDIPAEALAQGFEMNDLDKALAPIGIAVKKAIAAKVELDKLVEHVRGVAKRK